MGDFKDRIKNNPLPNVIDQITTDRYAELGKSLLLITI